MNAKTNKTVAPSTQTVKEAISNLDANGSTLAPELTPLQKLKQQAASKVYVTGGSTNLVGTFEVANMDDPRWSKLFEVMTKQAGKLVKEMLLRLDDKDRIVIDAGQAAEIDQELVHKSTTNKVVETYLPLLLGTPWPKSRGNQAMRDVVGEGVEFSFAMFKRIS